MVAQQTLSITRFSANCRQIPVNDGSPHETRGSTCNSGRFGLELERLCFALFVVNLCLVLKEVFHSLSKHSVHRRQALPLVQ